jgi:DeoR/GlpR family transcriptional regulator of sugar metabolism
MEAEEKRAIGAAAAQYVLDGETIIISSGTTTAEMIPHLANRQGLTVITNALNITLLLAQYPQITVIVLGGILRHSEMTTLGSLAEQALDNLRADKLFMGTRAVHAEYGISAENLAESHSDQALMKSARDIFVLADHTKFGKIATVRVATLDQVTRLITDGHLPDIELASIAETGVLIDRAG